MSALDVARRSLDRVRDLVPPYVWRLHRVEALFAAVASAIEAGDKAAIADVGAQLHAARDRAWADGRAGEQLELDERARKANTQ